VDQAGNGPTFDLSRTDSDSSDGLINAGEIKDFQSLASVDAGPAAAWNVELDVRDQPAGMLLRSLVRPLGLALKPAPALSAALAQRVTFRCRGRSRLEALEQICRQAGLHPIYEGRDVRLAAGPTPYPRQFHGPFLVQAGPVSENRALATGSLQVKCLAAGLPRFLADRLAADPQGAILLAVKAADGQGLARVQTPLRPNDRRVLPPRPELAKKFPHSWCVEATWSNVPLKNLLRDLDTIAEVQGRLRCSAPTRVEVFRFDRLVAGTTQKTATARCTLRKVPKDMQSRIPPRFKIQTPAGGGAPAPNGAGRPPGTRPSAPEPLGGTGSVLEFEAPGLGGRTFWWLAYDPDKRILGAKHHPWPADGKLRLAVPRGTAEVTLKVIAAEQDIGSEFRLRDIPLDRPPKRLDRPEFSGYDTPVSAALDPATRPKASAIVLPVLLTNHSQKPVEWVNLQITTLDAAGNKIKEAGTAWLARGTRPEEMLLPHARLSVRVQIPQLGQKVKEIQVRVTRVGFGDATTWSR
jgi:hypothetical protein